MIEFSYLEKIITNVENNCLNKFILENNIFYIIFYIYFKY